MYYSRLDHQQFSHRCQKHLPKLFVSKSEDIQKPGKDYYLVEIRTARLETSYVVLPRQTVRVN